MPPKQPRFLLLCILSALPALAQGQQNDTKKTNQMAEIEVSAPAERTPGTQAVDRSTLNRSAASDLGTALRYTPGVLVGDSKQQSNGSINIRGMNKNRIGMKIDGIDMPDGFFDWGHTSVNSSRGNGIEVDTLRQIDISKGASATAEDSASFGGSINMRTFRPSDFVSEQKPWYVGLKPSYSSVNSGKAFTFTGAGQSGGFSALLMLTRRDEAESKNMGKLNIDGPKRTKPNPQDIESTNILAKIALAGQNQRLDLTAEKFERDTDSDMRSNLTTSRGTQTLSETSKDEYSRSRLSAQYTLHQIPGWLDTFSAKLYHQKGEHDSTTNSLLNQQGRTIRQINSALFEQEISGAKLRLTGTLKSSASMEHKLNTELEYQKKDSSRPEYRQQISNGATIAAPHYPKKSMPDTNSKELTVSIADSMIFNNYGITVTPKINYQRHSLRPHIDQAYLNSGLDQPPQYDNNAFNPSLALDWSLNEQLSLHASWAHGTQNPTFDSLVGTLHPVRPPWTLMQFIPNPDLKTETSNSFDLGLNYSTDKLSLQFSTYYNRYHNFIERFGKVISDKPPALILMTDNLDDVKIWGAELAASWRFMPKWRFNGALSWMRGDQTSDHKTTPLDSAQPLRMMLGLGYDQGNWGADIDWTLSAKQKRLSSATLWRAPGYGIIDASAWWKASKYIEIQAGIYNLGDKKYYNPGDIELLNATGTSRSDLYTQPGRNASIMMTIHF